MELILFDNAKRAVAQLQEFDEVKEHLDKSAACQEYARRANDRDMEIRAAKYRVYCERRFGELLIKEDASRRQWHKEARREFRKGEKQACAICGLHKEITHAHHIIPLSKQDKTCAPNQEYVWLCPNHHAMLHKLMSPAAPINMILSMGKDELSALMELL